MKILYDGINYNNEQIEYDVKNMKDKFVETKDSVMLHVYRNEYERAVGAIISSTEKIPMFSIKSGGIPSWIYPYCHYKLEGLNGMLEKIDGNQKINADGVQLTAVLSETISFLSLSDDSMAEYKQILLNLHLDYSTVFIPSNLISITLTLALMSAFDFDKNIVLYKTSDDINEYIAENQGQYLLYVNGMQVGQKMLDEIQASDQVCAVIVCDIPIAGQFAEKIDGEFGGKKVYYLDIGISSEIVFRSHIDLITQQHYDNEYINLEGIRIDIRFIEKCISSYPLINKSTVAVQTDKTDVSRLICFYMIAQKNIDEQDIKQYLQQKMPWFAIPTRFVHVTELPISYDMKIDKNQLPNVFISDMDDYIEVDESIQKEAVDLLFKYINREVDDQDLNRPIESLGLNSLLFIEYVVSLEEKIGFEMPDSMLDIMLFKNMRHVLSYITNIVKG